MSRISYAVIGSNKKTIMKYLFILFLSLLSLATFSQSKKKWKQLFNGKDLKDWTVKISGHEVNEN